MKRFLSLDIVGEAKLHQIELTASCMSNEVPAKSTWQQSRTGKRAAICSGWRLHLWPFSGYGEIRGICDADYCRSHSLVPPPASEMAESSSSSGSKASSGSLTRVLIGLGLAGALGAVAAFALLGQKKQTRHLTPDVEIIDKL